MTAPGAIVAIAVAALIAMIAGCSAGSSSVAPVNRRTPESINPFSGVFPENQFGLEIQWWTVTDVDHALARALSPYAKEPTPIPARVRANWRRNGLRMVRVPVEDMGRLLSSLPIEDQVNRIWLGQTHGWTIAAPGAPWSGKRSLLIDGETIRLGAGQLRLLVRAWISPTEGPPTLRTDLALQYLDTPPSASARSHFSRATLRRPEDEGMIFRTLTASMELSSKYAYCIVSEDPDIDWVQLTRSDDDGGGERSGVRGDAPARSVAPPPLPERAPAPFDEPKTSDDDAALGPEPPGIPLLADALLSTMDLLPIRRRARLIVILTPVVPDEFQLAPTAAIPTPVNTPR